MSSVQCPVSSNPASELATGHRPLATSPRQYPLPLDLPACFICGSITVCTHREPELVAWYTEVQRARIYFHLEKRNDADPS